MPWRTVNLRGTRVLARCDGAGKLLEENGKVEIRYRPNDGKAYHALARNLAVLGSEPVLPDSHCAEAAKVEKKDNGEKPSARKKASAASTAPSKITGEHWIAYTDGACSGNPGPSGLGVVLLRGHERSELSEYLGVGTNNIAELTAILRALEAMDGELGLRLHTDSQYAIGVLTKGWKPKVNQELIQRIKDRMRHVKPLELVYVPGHAGVPLNERADALARAAIGARRSSGWQKVHKQHA